LGRKDACITANLGHAVAFACSYPVALQVENIENIKVPGLFNISEDDMQPESRTFLKTEVVDKISDLEHAQFFVYKDMFHGFTSRYLVCQMFGKLSSLRLTEQLDLLIVLE